MTKYSYINRPIAAITIMRPIHEPIIVSRPRLTGTDTVCNVSFETYMAEGNTLPGRHSQIIIPSSHSQHIDEGRG